MVDRHVDLKAPWRTNRSTQLGSGRLAGISQTEHGVGGGRGTTSVPLPPIWSWAVVALLPASPHAHLVSATLYLNPFSSQTPEDTCRTWEISRVRNKRLHWLGICCFISPFFQWFLDLFSVCLALLAWLQRLEEEEEDKEEMLRRNQRRKGSGGGGGRNEKANQSLSEVWGLWGEGSHHFLRLSASLWRANVHGYILTNTHEVCLATHPDPDWQSTPILSCTDSLPVTYFWSNKCQGPRTLRGRRRRRKKRIEPSSPEQYSFTHLPIAQHNRQQQ